MPTALTIAGSDSSGGAGIQADLKTFAAHGVYGTSAVTAITAQNTEGVRDVLPLPPDIVRAQIDAVLDDFSVQAVKIGMLATGAIAAAVLDALRQRRPPHIVLDTVLQSSSGRPLLDAAGVALLTASWLAYADVVTVNRPEAEILTGRAVRTLDEGRGALEALARLGVRAAVLKGGHFEGPATDLLYEEGVFTEVAGERIETRHTHGTGCTLASAIAAHLAHGDTVLDAVRSAKHYVTEALRHAPGLGRGHGPLGHLPVPGR